MMKEEKNAAKLTLTLKPAPRKIKNHWSGVFRAKPVTFIFACNMEFMNFL
jgi:hypothetical protein